MLSREDFIKELDTITIKLNWNEGYIAKYKLDDELVEYIVSMFGSVYYDVHFPFDLYNYAEVLEEIKSDLENKL